MNILLNIHIVLWAITEPNKLSKKALSFLRTIIIIFTSVSPPCVIHTTNAIESLNASFRKVTKNRAAFPNDEAIIKIMYLAVSKVAKKWNMPIKNWRLALNQFAILFGVDRVFGI